MCYKFIHCPKCENILKTTVTCIYPGGKREGKKCYRREEVSLEEFRKTVRGTNSQFRFTIACRHCRRFSVPVANHDRLDATLSVSKFSLLSGSVYWSYFQLKQWQWLTAHSARQRNPRQNPPWDSTVHQFGVLATTPDFAPTNRVQVWIPNLHKEFGLRPIQRIQYLSRRKSSGLPQLDPKRLCLNVLPESHRITNLTLTLVNLTHTTTNPRFRMYRYSSRVLRHLCVGKSESPRVQLQHSALQLQRGFLHTQLKGECHSRLPHRPSEISMKWWTIIPMEYLTHPD